MSDQAASWKVTGAAPTQARDSTGAVVPGWNVSYQLASGATGQVFVPKSVSDLDAVKAAVAADAETLHNITTLTSG